MKQFDIVVLGGGIYGLYTALFLAHPQFLGGNYL